MTGFPTIRFNAPEAAHAALIACRNCDRLQALPDLRAGQTARCGRCSHVLTEVHHESLERAFALAAAGLLLLILSASYPFLGVSAEGQLVQMTLLDSAVSLFQYQEPLLATLVFAFVFLLPTVLLCTQLLLLMLLLSRRFAWLTPWLTRLILGLASWNMVEVFMLGVLVSIAKLSTLATVQIGLSFWCFLGFALCTVATQATLDPYQLWRVVERNRFGPNHAVPAAGTVAGCDRCGKVLAAQTHRCPVCAQRLQVRIPNSLQTTVALLATAIVLYIPANFLPIMSTTEFGVVIRSTIAGGIVLLWQDGSYPTAIVIFVASLLVPILKIVLLCWLCWSVYAEQRRGARQRSFIYRITEFVGRWSMVDVFVVALLVALFQFGTVLSVEPGAAALAFCGVVIVTMLAARSFDPRLIWDHQPQPPLPGSAPTHSQ
ncbi:MAG: PqiA/YebS family transporter subunit [Pseudomonadales bacterium]